MQSLIETSGSLPCPTAAMLETAQEPPTIVSKGVGTWTEGLVQRSETPRRAAKGLGKDFLKNEMLWCIRQRVCQNLGPYFAEFHCIKNPLFTNGQMLKT